MSDTPPPQQQQPAQTKTYKLTTKNLFNHYLLVHDFLYKFSKSPANDSKYLDAQLDVQTIMNNATTNGGRFGQVASLGVVAAYCLRSNHIGLKFMAGFLYVYWFNHFLTLGQYFGALIKMPAAYKRLGDYYQKYHPQHPNLLDNFESIMQKQVEYEDTHQILDKIFPQADQSKENSYTTNQYFIKNRDKYDLPKEGQSINLKLPYLDSLLTRYIYYSFTRWLHRVNMFLGIAKQ